MQILFSWSLKSLQTVTTATKLKDTCSLEGSYHKDRQHISRDITFPTKVCVVKAMVFPVVVEGYESWSIKKAEHWRIDAFELWCWRRLESPLDCKEIKPANPKENQCWIFIGRTDAEAPILWLPTWYKELIHWEEEPDVVKDLEQEKKGVTEDEMVRWHHRLNGHGLSKLWERMNGREAWRAAVHELTELGTA